METKFITRNVDKQKRAFKAQPLDINLQKMQKGLEQKCESEMSEVGDFEPIVEIYTVHKNYQGELYADEIKLVCRKAGDSGDDAQRVLELVVTNIEKTTAVHCVIAEGTKEEIIEELNDVGLFLDIKDHVWAICSGF